tara:strand:+ start:4673 stop:6259 length:1587 start_codon:yes stop_codon:yes gene_type:complete
MSEKKSNFPALTTVDDGSTFDFVASGQNFKITKADLLAALGVTGTLSQEGDVTGTPVLDGAGTDYLIRNLEAGDGINIGVSPDNGILISVPSVDAEVGTLEQVTTNGNETDQGMVLTAGAELELRDSDGDTRGFAAINPTNVVVINSLSDFPDPIAGVIELVPSPLAEITYLIAADTIDVSPNVFSVTNGEIVIRGTHRTGSQIYTTGAGVLFTVSESSFFQEYVAFNCPNADWIDFSSSGGFLSLANQNVIILDCQSLGTIQGAFTTSLRTMTIASTSVGGFTWTGTGDLQINITNFLAFGWTGTLLDLGTATFSIISIVGGNRFISPTGTTIISGLANNGNFSSSSGRGAIEGNLFNGTGTALVGIDPQDTQYNFDANSGVADSKVDADAFLTSQLVTIGSAGVYVAVGGVNWTSALDNRFTVDTAGIMTYDGIGDVDVLVIATSTIEKAGGGSDLICTKLALNTGGGLAVIDATVGCTQSTNPTQVTSQGIITMSSGDQIQLWAANTGSTSNVTVSDSSISLVSM